MKQNNANLIIAIKLFIKHLQEEIGFHLSETKEVEVIVPLKIVQRIRKLNLTLPTSEIINTL